MFGLTSSGCFITGVVFGFILAAFLGISCIFFFNPEIKNSTLNRIEEIWGNVKKQVDGSISAAKNAPVAEPEIKIRQNSSSETQQGQRLQQQQANDKKTNKSPLVEIKLGF